MLRMPDVSLAGILDTHLLFSPPLLFCIHVAAIRSWSPGADDLDAFFNVEINDDQELTGGSQAGGLAFSVCVCYLC